MAEMNIKYLSGADLQNSDTTGSTKFQDVVLTAGVETTVGEYEVPAGVKKAYWGGDKCYFALYDDTTTAVVEPGLFKFYVVGPSGNAVLVNQMRSDRAAPSGQSATPTEWNFLPRSGRWTKGGGKLRLTFVPDASDTTDSTDHVFTSLPITEIY